MSSPSDPPDPNNDSSSDAGARSTPAQGVRREIDLAIGAWFFCDEHWNQNPESVQSCVRAFDWPSWGSPLRVLISQAVPGKRHPRKAGTLKNQEFVDVATDLLTHPDLWEVQLGSKIKNRMEYLAVGTHPEAPGQGVVLYAARPVEQDQPQLHHWVDNITGLAAQLGATMGIVTVMHSAEVSSEVTLGGVVRNSVLQHPFPDQFEATQRVRWQLGLQYIRFPRWGTLLSNEHIARLGGIDKIQQVVQPARVTPCGGGMYIQLTESVNTAMTNEALAKQAMFTELAQPLLP